MIYKFIKKKKRKKEEDWERWNIPFLPPMRKGLGKYEEREGKWGKRQKMSY
jgi:hypothetical protein